MERTKILIILIIALFTITTGFLILEAGEIIIKKYNSQINNIIGR